MDATERQRRAEAVVSQLETLTRLLSLGKCTTHELKECVLRAYLAGAAPDTIVNTIILYA